MGPNNPKQSKTLRRILLAVLPGLIITGGLLYASSNVYYDLDTQKTMIETPGGFTVFYGDTAISGSSITLNPSAAVDITAGAASTWKTTSGADLTIQSAGDITATSTGAMIFGTAGNERIRILDTGQIGIATTSPRYTLEIFGGLGVGTSTTPTLYVASTTGRVGIATSSPSEALTVQGNIYGSGNIVITGTATTTQLFVTSTSTLGTVTSGTWQGTAIADDYVANDITLTNITQITSRDLGDMQGTLALASTTGTLVTTQGGTGQDTSDWTGFPYITGGSWGTSTVVTSESDPLWTASGTEAELENILGIAFGTEKTATSGYFLVGDGTDFESQSASSTRTTLEINNVENVAISTWAGSSNILTVGTIGSGTWEGTEVADEYVADDIALTNITQITNRAITDTSGTLTVARGGTGATTLTSEGVLLGQGTSAISAVAAPADTYKVLSTLNGTVIAWNALESSHIPDLAASKITSGTFADERIASAATWNAKMTNPMTTLGDIIYGGASGAPTRLGGSTGFLKSTGAAIPSWSAVNLGTGDVTGNLAIAGMPTGGNWDISSDNLTVETDTLFIGRVGGSYAGRVGIGTTTPAYKLDVHASGCPAGHTDNGDGTCTATLDDPTEDGYIDKLDSGYYYRIDAGTASQFGLWSGIVSLLSGTNILMHNGETKHIEGIQVGEKVVSFDPYKNTSSISEVLSSTSRTASEYLIINGTLKITPNHLLWSSGSSGFVEAHELKVGDYLLDRRGQKLRIESIEEISAKVVVYSLTISSPHTYFAEGFLVHNIDVHWYRGYAEWDIIGIDDDATITKVEFRYHGKRNPTTDNCWIYAMASQPSVQSDNDAGNQVIFDDAGDGTAYLSNDVTFPEVGTGKDVGGAAGPSWDSDPKGDAQSALAGNWFALGFKSTEATDVDNGEFYAEEYGSANPKPTLEVTYTSPAVRMLSVGSNVYLAPTSGKVGIGTTTPAALLDVYASSTATGLTIFQGGTGNIAEFKNATGTVFTIANGGNVTVAGDILPATTTTYNLGSDTYIWANIYAATTTIGDIVFANQFRITEAMSSSTSTPEALIFQNASSVPIMTIDENGKLVTEKIEIKVARVQKLEMVDQFTDEIWCTWIENGEWVKTLGECNTATSSTSTLSISEVNNSTSSTSTDSNLPETTIDSHPAPETTANEAYFTFGSSDFYAIYQCKLNLEEWVTCTSPKTYSGLLPGEYQFQVFATDAQGNYDETPATFSWTILESSSEPEATTTEETATTTDQTVTSTEPVATSTEPVATSTEPTSTTTEPVCQPAEEICDGVDNDCDGEIDEDLGQTTCGVGACEVTVDNCVDGVSQTCTPGTSTEEICDRIDNDCDGQIDEEVNCGITSCDTTLNLIGECQNPCFEGSCQVCTPTCTCAAGFSDCDNDMTNGCETASSTCPAAEPPAE